MTYIEFIYDFITDINVSMPIYTKQIAYEMSKENNISQKEAAAAVAVAIKRIMDNDKIPELRLHQKGIYYKTKTTPFGEIGINKEQLIADKYILPHIGYETGLTLMNRMGLTTQISNERIIATNLAKDSVRTDKKLGVTIKPPKTQVNIQNKKYLQLLDAIELIDKTPIDEGNPFDIISRYIKNENMQYEKLLAYADSYYNQKTILHLAHTASAGGVNI